MNENVMLRLGSLSIMIKEVECSAKVLLGDIDETKDAVSEEGFFDEMFYIKKKIEQMIRKLDDARAKANQVEDEYNAEA